MSEASASGLNFYVLHIAGTHESSVVPADGYYLYCKDSKDAVTGAKIENISKLTGASTDTSTGICMKLCFIRCCK